jgi:hydrophobe/amphiphile efflux-1 (HAE1) family protein
MSEDKKTSANNLYFFIKKPRFAMVISILITLMGLVAIFSLKMEKYPDVTPPQVTVTASYPGASSSVIESSVASVMESQINGVENMLYMISTSADEIYTLQIYFKVGTNKDINLVNVQNRLQQVQPKLPEEVKRLGVSAITRVAGSGVCILSLISPDNSWSQLDLTNYASIFIKDELKRLGGVGEVNVYGAGDYSMRIWLNTQKMANLNVSVAEVQKAIQTQNLQVSTGALGQEPSVDKQSLKMTLRTKGRLLEPSEFENIIIRSNTAGSSIRIKDIARVELGAQTYNTIGRVDGEPVAILQIVQMPGANAIDIVNLVNKKMTQLRKALPDGLKISMLHDDTMFIKEAMREVEFTIFLTSIIVVLIIFVFLGDWRATLIPCIAIPVSLIGTFFALPPLGMSINLLTLFAMVLAVATVVDDAIVVIENVKRHLEEGKSPIEATQITMQEVGGALVAMALVLIAVFVPVIFVSGLSGLMYKQFAVCIAVSIALSAVCALSLSPALCSMLLREEDPNRQPSNMFTALIKKSFLIFDKYFSQLTEIYIEYVKKFVYDKKKTIILYTSIIALMLVLFKLIPTGFIPDEDQGVLISQVSLPAGASLSRTSDVMTDFETSVKNIEGVEKIIVFAGMGPTNQAFAIIRLNPWHERELGIFSKAHRQLFLVWECLEDLSFRCFQEVNILLRSLKNIQMR